MEISPAKYFGLLVYLFFELEVQPAGLKYFQITKMTSTQRKIHAIASVAAETWIRMGKRSAVLIQRFVEWLTYWFLGIVAMGEVLSTSGLFV